MHENSQRLMAWFCATYLTSMERLSVLDVGAKDYDEGSPGNGTYKKHFMGAGQYVGADIEPGANVDHVMPDEFTILFLDGAFDVVISGQTLEHARYPNQLVKEMARVLRSGGLMCLIAPFKADEHKYPRDCWRILPDGMRVLMGDAGLEVKDAHIEWVDTIAVGYKPTESDSARA